MRLVASLLETPRPLLCASQRQLIRISDSFADLVTLLNGDVIESTDHSDSVARLRVDIARSERTSAAFRRRMEVAIADSVGFHTQLKATQVESATWQASALKTTEVIESLKKSIFTLEKEAARVSDQ